MKKNSRTLLPQREIKDLPTKSAIPPESANTIEKVSSQLMNGGLSGILKAREQKLIVAELKACHEEKVVETAICRVKADAEKKIVEIGLQSEELRENILLKYNQKVGNLNRQHQTLVTRAMTKVIENETLDQELLSRSDVLEEDRIMLEEFLQQQASIEIQSIASTNGVLPSGQGDASENENL